MLRHIKGLIGLSVELMLVSLILGNLALAQTGTTSLRGTVTDKTGATVAGAIVHLVNMAQATERESATGSAGEYELLGLQPGVYTLSVEKVGFRKYEQAKIQLQVNSPVTQNVTLEVGLATEVVEVTAKEAALNTSDASLGNAFDENQIKQLPMDGRNVPDLLSLQAGVAYTGNRPDINRDNDTRSGAVNGARSDQSNITLDGVDVNTDTKGYAFTSVLPITADSVQEFRVTTSNYNSDEGRSSGAQVSLVTKSGTDTFHGSLYEFNRNTFTSANDYFVKLAQLQSGDPNKAPQLIRNNFGGSLGGPIVKQRLFFFVNYEAGRQAEAQSIVRVVPSAAMRDGVLTYTCADQTMCPATSVMGLTGSHPIAAGNYGLTPGQIQSMDPQGIGVSQNVMIPYFNSFPLPNDNSVGDGVNFEGFRFSGPVKINTNWYIARADYKLTSSGNHSLFWRGALRNDTNAGAPYLLGQSAQQTVVDYSKGFSAGYSAVLRSNLVNNFRWGFTRQSFGQVGNQTQPYVQFRGLNDNSTPNNSSLAEVPTLTYQVPVHNFVDDVSWIKGKHTLQFGGNINILRNPQSSNVNSFSTAVTNASWFVPSGLANQGGAFDPPTVGLPQVDSGFNNNYDYPMIALVGMINEVNAQYNFNKNGSTVPQGAPVTRRFAADTWELYAQDTWKIKPNLTFTYGLRYSLFSPPWETNGVQVSPNVNLTNWLNLREQNMLQGIGSNAAPLISFDLAGPANGKPGFYNWDKKDFGPRMAIAYSPGATDGLWGAIFGGPGKSSIRAGAGIVYDRVGPALLATFDESGSFGLSTTIQSQAGIVSPTTAPRITGLNAIPTQGTDGTVLFGAAPVSTFPQTYPANAFAVYWGSDKSLKTPYSYTFDLSVERDFGRGFSLDVAYVGRMSHRLLTQEDVATPEDIVDPKTKVDYFAAATALAKIYRTGVPTANIFPTCAPGQLNCTAVGPTAQYWADILQPLVAGGAYSQVCSGGSTPSALQAAYDLFSCFSGNESTAIQLIDQGILTDANIPGQTYYGPGGPYSFLDSQFAALYAWRSIGASAYNGLQVSFRHHMSHGLQFDFNYTYSKSMDISSDAARIGAEAGLGGQVINAWNPKALRAVSDFDLPHQVNANWIWELPFGKGRRFGNGSGKALDALIGGWQLTGLARWTSGFPVGVSNGAQWPTNWQLSGFATQICPVTTKGAVKGGGSVNIFGNSAAAAAALSCYQADFPGQVGARNTLRGDGFAGLDAGLAKRWRMPWKESHTLQFRWEVFNALNLTRFDVNTLNLSITNASTFGDYSGLLTNPRTMQFALRYEF